MSRLDKSLQELIEEGGPKKSPGRPWKRKRCGASADIKPKAAYSKPKALDDEPPADLDVSGVFECVVRGFPDTCTPDQAREALDLLRVNWLSLRRCFVLGFPDSDKANRFGEYYDRGQVEIPAETFIMRRLAAEASGGLVKRSGTVELDVQTPLAPRFPTRGKTWHESVYVGFPESFTARDLREALEASEIPEELLPDIETGFAVSFRSRSLAMQFRTAFHGQQVTMPLRPRFRLSVGL